MTKLHARLGFVPLALAALFTSCNNASTPEGSNLYVAQNLGICQGLAPQPYSCLLVKENPSDVWHGYSESIQGFKYEPGYRYKLLVSVKVEQPPIADAENRHYTLIKIVDKVLDSTTATQ